MLHSKTDHEELIDKSTHLLYEIQQFEDKCRRLAQFAEAKDIEEYILHSVFESCLIHTRIIYEFLFQPGRETDIRANDFKEKVEYPLPGIIDDYLKGWARRMIDKRLMHLTTNRLTMTKEDHRWEINTIYRPLRNQLLVFYAWVPDEHICEDLKRKKEKGLLEIYSSIRNESVSAPWGFNVVLDTSGPSLVINKE